MKKRSLFCVALFSVAAMLSACSSEDPKTIERQLNDIAGLDGVVTFAVLPDTQKYSRYSPERFYAQTQWIADNYEKQKIEYTLQLGDIVDTPMDDSQWDVAVEAFSILDANPETPYALAAGNHDVLAYQTADVDINENMDDIRDLSTEPFLQRFSVGRQQGNFPSFKGADPTGFNSYHIVEAEGREYLILALDWRPSDATLEWAQSILDQNRQMPTVIITHQLMDIVNDTQNAMFTSQGTRIWDKLIKDNDQVFLAVNGHHHGEGKMVAKNAYGREVVLVVVDYQSAFWGGNGMLQLIRLNEKAKEMQFSSISPWVEQIPPEDRQPQDQLERWRFTIPMDFEQRFANLNESTLSDNPGNIEGTVAYWVFDKENQITTGSDELVFADLSGNGNSLALKASPDNTLAMSELYQLIDDTPGFGYANGAIRLSNRKENDVPQLVYLGSNAPIAGGDGVLEQYTVEIVVRLSPDWSVEDNRWGALLAHQPSQGQVCQFHKLECDGGDPSMAAAVSSLKEFQWQSVSSNGIGPSNWSWEVSQDYWYHVVIVNDGKFATMSVDNSQVMRTAEQEQQGLLTIPGGEWTVGVSSWEGEPSGLFRGDIAEIRISNRPLDKKEWLINQY